MPDQKTVYPNLDKGKWGLIPVAQLDTYKGLIFATFDPGAPTLPKYLGDMRFYLDCLLDRREGGTELIGGVHKWIIETNWKMPAENMIGDVYHAPVSHSSIITAATALNGEGLNASMQQITEHGRNVAPEPGHGITVRVLPEGLPPDTYLPGDAASLNPVVLDYFRSVQPEAEKRLGALRTRLKPATLTIYPNFSWIGGVFTIRVAHPRGPGKTEFCSWVIVDRDAPEEVRDVIRQSYILTFGPSGTFEQDDGENWQQVTFGSRGTQAVKYPYHFAMAMGEEAQHAELPGLVSGPMSEHTQRAFYLRWRNEMSKT